MTAGRQLGVYAGAGKSDLFWKIKHGIRLTGMPSFGYSLGDREISTLALFLKHMDKLPPAVQQTWLQVQNWPVTSENPTGQK